MSIHPTNYPVHPSPKFEKAINALQELSESAGVSACQDAFAYATAKSLENHFAMTRGVTPAKGPICIQRLLGAECLVRHNKVCACNPPAAQHRSLWEKDGQVRYYVTELYRIDCCTVLEAANFAQNNKLTFEFVGGEGSYYPSKTFAMIYWNPNIPRY